MMIYLIGFGFDLAKVLDDMGFTVFAGCLLGGSDGAQTFFLCYLYLFRNIGVRHDFHLTDVHVVQQQHDGCQ
jgi:fructose-1-phosphate kinase PfkB-like protein